MRLTIFGCLLALSIFAVNDAQGSEKNQINPNQAEKNVKIVIQMLVDLFEHFEGKEEPVREKSTQGLLDAEKLFAAVKKPEKTPKAKKGKKQPDALKDVLATSALISSGKKTKKKHSDKLEAKMAKLDQIIAEAAQVNGIDPLLVKAVGKVESNLDPKAVSAKGAKGVMQIMPINYRHMDIDPFDPVENIHAGARLLSDNLYEFDGNVRLALAAYNAGPTKVRQKKRVPNNGETKEYVEKVLKTYKEYRSRV
jgi:soluble lytic murein transglycosylase